MVLFDSATAAEERDNENNNADNDENDRSELVEVLIGEVHVRIRVYFSPDANYQDDQSRNGKQKIEAKHEVLYTGHSTFESHCYSIKYYRQIV